MSGQKTATITVASPSLLLGALGAAGAVAVGAAALAGVGVVAGGVALAKGVANEVSRRREAARRERERKVLDAAKSRLKTLKDELAALDVRATRMAARFSGEEVPAPYELQAVDENDAGAILAMLSDAEAGLARYRSRLHESLLSLHRREATAEGRDEVLALYGAHAPAAPRAVHGAAAAAAALHEETLRGRRAEDEELRRGLFESAREIMAKLDEEVATVPEALREQLEAVLTAASHSEAQIAKARLGALVEEELARNQEERERRSKEAERLRNDRVAALMAQSLEEMGYVVSGIDESAYTRDGEIIACHPDTSDHALRLTIDRDSSRVTSNVVRLVESEADAEAEAEAGAGAAERRRQDAEADNRWCNPRDPQGIGTFRKKLGESGVVVNFARSRADDAARIGTVSIDDLLEASPSIEEHFRREHPALRQRAHGPDRRKT